MASGSKHCAACLPLGLCPVSEMGNPSRASSMLRAYWMRFVPSQGAQALKWLPGATALKNPQMCSQAQANGSKKKKSFKESLGGTSKMDRQMSSATICLTPSSCSTQTIKHKAATSHAMATAIPDLVTLLKRRVEERLG